MTATLTIESTISPIVSLEPHLMYFFVCVDSVPGRRLQRHELRYGRAIEWHEEGQNQAEPCRARLPAAEQMMDNAMSWSLSCPSYHIAAHKTLPTGRQGFLRDLALIPVVVPFLPVVGILLWRLPFSWRRALERRVV